MPSEIIFQLKDRYKNGYDNIGKDLIGACLSECKLYRRGTAYFSSSALMSWSAAMDHVINDKVKIEIICSPVISDRHLVEILKGSITSDQRKKTIQQLADNIVLTAVGFGMNSERRDYRSQLLSYLIATGQLEFRFAIPKNYEFPDEKSDDRNLYHVKVGYFVFEDDSIVAFEGSINESDSAYQYNTESAQVFKSWLDEDLRRVNNLVLDVNTDWSRENPHIEVFNLSKEAIEKIGKLSPSERPRKPKPVIAPEPEAPKPASGLRPYQEEALNAWKENDYKGILTMATGTGKTKTSIEALTRFLSRTDRGLAVITVPYLELARQWVQELGEKGIATVSVYDSQENWSLSAENIIQAHLVSSDSKAQLPVLVCVNKSFRDDKFQNLLKRLNGKPGSRMIIVDECHHFNRQNQIDYLPTSFRFRLGLSATPYELDEEKYLERYFGEIVFEFKLSEAIKQEYLCPYTYHPILIEFTENEAARYLEIIKKVTNNKDLDSYGELDHLLETMVSKLTKLEDVLKENSSKTFSLFYCGEGYVEFENGERIRQVDSLTMLLQKLGWRVGRITSADTPSERRGTIANLRAQNIDAIASMRILDEGIDIPDCRRAFILASQRQERQGIQRRGRVLRKSPGKESAELFDFILVGPKLTNQDLDKLYNREMKRARMFASDALNKDECEKILDGV
ncbi:DEAD/DEAH box helicase family protein [Polynucleobacter sp.]|uniref:DEAD/DEAH box helicase family protein n=1 Tax=Polynucleobacter sp. TaxID=2029855 RepID=UPI0027357105|nr:DEAD/DEAH box helicase family protein [Polynucleobacter sp.]MDP3122399.1 DEAD/DEAH box helicase family protein [Polynucleobacter sp.]